MTKQEIQEGENVDKTLPLSAGGTEAPMLSVEHEQQRELLKLTQQLMEWETANEKCLYEREIGLVVTARAMLQSVCLAIQGPPA